MKQKINFWNDADTYSQVTSTYRNLFDIECIINALPYYTKPSKQRNKVGSLVFDPVKTNNFFKENLRGMGWKPNVKIPSSFRHMGKDVDFLKDGIVVEVQFSNYPFLLNNIIRTALFKNSGLELDNRVIEELVIITKTKDIPSANSSLYYEQAKNQIDSIVEYNMVDLPITLIGLHNE